MPTTANVLQNDDNLSPGITYTFSFKSCNTFFDGSTATILGDIQASAPDFIGSVSVNYSTAFTNLASLWATFLNVTFTYTGDGSDVVSDVANALIACFQSGSNDCFTFQQATGGTAGISAVNQVQDAATVAAQTVGSTAGSIVGQTTSGLFSNLGTTGWIVIIVAVLAVLAYFSASTGLRVPSGD